jgi:hypothetical protein
MATINIYDLRPTGSDLFSDSETFMNDLVNSELGEVSGGGITQQITSRVLSAAAATGAPVVSFVATVVITGVVAYTILAD